MDCDLKRLVRLLDCYPVRLQVILGIKLCNSLTLNPKISSLNASIYLWVQPDQTHTTCGIFLGTDAVLARILWFLLWCLNFRASLQAVGTTPGYVVILLFLGKALHVALAKADDGRCEWRPEKGGWKNMQQKFKEKTREEWKLRLLQFQLETLLCSCIGRLSLIYIWHTSSVAPCSTGIHCVSKCSNMAIKGILLELRSAQHAAKTIRILTTLFCTQTTCTTTDR